MPFKEGGGTSRFSRFIQPFLTKYLPGNPTIKIMHIPGGGAIKGSNYFQKMQNQMEPISWMLDICYCKCCYWKSIS